LVVDDTDADHRAGLGSWATNRNDGGSSGSAEHGASGRWHDRTSPGVPGFGTGLFPGKLEEFHADWKLTRAIEIAYPRRSQPACAGRGSIVGTLVGALIVGVFRSAVSLAGIDVLRQEFAIGVLIIGQKARPTHQPHLAQYAACFRGRGPHPHPPARPATGSH
jgi:hypothetical protein